MAPPHAFAARPAAEPRPPLASLLLAEVDRRHLTVAAHSLGCRLVHCLTFDELCFQAEATGGLIVVLDDAALRDPAAVHGLRAACGPNGRIVWRRRTELEPPWALVDEVIAGPVPAEVWGLRVRALANELAARGALQRERRHFDDLLQERMLDINSAVEHLRMAEAQSQHANLDTIFRLAVAAEFRDAGTAAHLERMSHYSVIVADELGCPEEDRYHLTYASMMHDVGKIGIPDAILLKPGRLDPQEWEIMRQHPAVGESILSGSNSPLLEAAAAIAGCHHERWDGAGYPRKLAREEIPLFARIVAVADVYDAMTSHRCYRPGGSSDVAFESIGGQRGRHFDPDVVDAFLDRREEIETVQRLGAAAREDRRFSRA